MNRFYETVVKYDRIGEEGNIEKVTEQFLLLAVSCTDTEASIIGSLHPFIKGECDVMSVKLSKYSEYIPENEIISRVDGDVQHLMNKNSSASTEADKYYAVKVSFIEIDDKGKKKKTPSHYCVHATSTDAAFRTVEQFLKDTISDYEVNSIVETKIVDVIADTIEDTAFRFRKFMKDHDVTIKASVE